MDKLVKTEYNNRIGKVRRIDHDEIQIEENAIPLGDRGREIIQWQHANVDDEVAFNVNSRDGTLIYLCVISRAKKPDEPTRSSPAKSPRSEPYNGLDSRRDTSEPDMYGVAYGTGEYDY
jgi:hypothetical protein